MPTTEPPKIHFLNAETDDATCSRAQPDAPRTKRKKTVTCGLCLRSMRAAGLIEGTNTRAAKGKGKSSKPKAKTKKNGKARKNGTHQNAAGLSTERAGVMLHTLLGLATETPLEMRTTVQIDGQLVPVTMTVRTGH